MRPGERLGKFDDEHVIYRADDPDQSVAWRRAAWTYLAAAITTPVLLAWLRALLGAQAAFVALFAVLFACLVVYVVWRRRRNLRRTGFPARWPTPKAD
jgi:uncharacterized membrane protein YfcA